MSPAPALRGQVLHGRDAVHPLRRRGGLLLSVGRRSSRELGWFGFVAMLIFIVPLGVGLVYEWMKGAPRMVISGETRARRSTPRSRSTRSSAARCCRRSTSCRSRARLDRRPRRRASWRRSSSSSPIEVMEVVSFYNMFYDRPQGRHHVHVCTNLPCSLRGARDLLRRLEAAPRRRSRRDHGGRARHARPRGMPRRLRLRADDARRRAPTTKISTSSRPSASSTRSSERRAEGALRHQLSDRALRRRRLRARSTATGGAAATRRRSKALTEMSARAGRSSW